MRIRQVKPAFWADAKLAALPHDARLFYIGLWMLADDEGWLRWDVAEIGAELYGFEGRGSREKRIEKMAQAIRSMPGSEKLAILECGHAQVPRLAVHQHLAGTTRRVTTVFDEHRRCLLPRLPANPRDSAEIPAPYGVSDSEGKGSFGDGGGSPALKRESEEPRFKKPSPEEERDRAIARALAKLNDPTASEDIKASARVLLSQMGLAA